MPGTSKKEICKVCRYGAEPREDYFFISKRELKESATRGCEVCTFIVRGLSACLPLLEWNTMDLLSWDEHGRLGHFIDEKKTIYELYVPLSKFSRPLNISYLLAHARKCSNNLL